MYNKKFGLGLSLKRDWDAILLGSVVGALALPHVPVLKDVLLKANSFITDKVGL